MKSKAKGNKAEKKESKQSVPAITDKERIDKGQILARIIIEVLGAPKEYVEEAIKLVIDRAKSVQQLEVVSESTYEAEEKGKLYCTFSELEIWFQNMDVFSRFLFDFNPSSVEVIQPQTVPLKALFLSGFFNDFLLKMHELGLKVKDNSAKTQLLQKNTDVLVRNFISFLIAEPKSVEDISKATGIPTENVKAMLENFVKAGVARQKGSLYVLAKK
jgi:hypothetical protein